MATTAPTPERAWLLPAIATALLAVGAVWFFATHQYVEERVWVGLKGEARRDPYFGLKRFMAAMGANVRDQTSGTAVTKAPVQVIQAALAAPADNAVMLLTHRRQITILERHARELQTWVAKGGHLIVEAEAKAEPDAVLDVFGVKRADLLRQPAPAASSGSTAPQPRGQTQPISATLPDSVKTFELQYHPFQRLEYSGPALLRVEDPRGLHIVQLAHGKGRVTVVSNFTFLRHYGRNPAWGKTAEDDAAGSAKRAFNQSLSGGDHAEFIWRIATSGIKEGAAPIAWVIWGRDRLSIWKWLGDNASAVLIALAALLALWLWRVIPRFGPLQPDAPQVQLSLRTHLQAVGAFLWRQNGAETMFHEARRELADQIKRKKPAWSNLPPNELAKELAIASKTNPRAVLQMMREPVNTPQQFYRNVRLVQAIRNAL